MMLSFLLGPLGRPYGAGGPRDREEGVNESTSGISSFFLLEKRPIRRAVAGGVGVG